MVSVINNGQTNIYFGLSTDSYPVDIPNGSTLHDMDTTAEYLYDAENNAWIKQRDGGGGGGASVLVVNVTEDDLGGLDMDKTASEIAAAFPFVRVHRAQSGNDYTDYAITSIVFEEPEYTIKLDELTFYADAGSDYPAWRLN